MSEQRGYFEERYYEELCETVAERDRLKALNVELLAALKRFTRAPCSFDVLNPCFANRPEDAVGKHWGGGEACPECHASAAIAKAEQEAQS
ncbi:MAG TPA: hypothetical protein VJJ83_02090 [Candidatus Babeliales bacterium]|nr:hypothetical protein [Candidatus Babeliales bacterium]